MKKGDAEKLLNHWIEHNEGHSRSFREWAVQMEEISQEAANSVLEAAELMDRCTDQLRRAKDAI